MSKKSGVSRASSLPSAGEGSLTPDGRNALKGFLISENISHLMGSILTIVDASVEGDKNIAMKSLIKQAFFEKQDWIGQLIWAKKEEIGSGHAPRNMWEDGLVPFESNGKRYSFTVSHY